MFLYQNKHRTVNNIKTPAAVRYLKHSRTYYCVFRASLHPPPPLTRLAGILQGGGDGRQTAQGAAGVVSGEDGFCMEGDEVD